VNLTGDWNWEYIAAFNHLGKLRRLPDLSRRGEYVGHRISVPYPHAYIVTRQYITKQCGGAADDE
jgi:hypothetical protein